MRGGIIIVAGGSGQHATVVYETAILSAMHVIGFSVLGGENPKSVLDCNVLGKLEEIAEVAIGAGCHFIIAVGSNTLRHYIYEFLAGLGASFQSVVHPSAIVSPSAVITEGSVLLAGAIVSTGARLGRCVIVNHAASVDHGCQIGDFVNISPGARLGGSVRIGDGVSIGLNASVLQGCILGNDVVVGAGAVVTRDVDQGTVVVGIPARPLGKTTR